MAETRIELNDGKYTVIHENGVNFHALRYGEPWRNLTGDGLVLAMAQHIEDLEQRLITLADECASLIDYDRNGDSTFLQNALERAGFPVRK